MGHGGPAETDELLHAYVDEMLPPKERLEVEGYLASSAELRARVAAYRRQVLDLHAVYDDHLNDEPPRRIRELEARLHDELARRRGSPRLTPTTVTATLLAVGLGIGLYGADRIAAPVTGDSLFALLAERTLALTGTRGAAVGEEATPLRQTNLEAAPPADAAGRAAPDLGAFGFQLMASRTVRAGNGIETVQLTYESSEHGRLLLYLSPRLEHARHEDKISLNEEGAVTVLLWSDARHSYSMIGENLDRNAMLALGKAVNHSFADASDQGEPDAGPAEPSQLPEGNQLHGGIPDKSA